MELMFNGGKKCFNGLPLSPLELQEPQLAILQSLRRPPFFLFPAPTSLLGLPSFFFYSSTSFALFDLTRKLWNDAL